MTCFDDNRINLISSILDQKAVSSRNFTQYMAQKHQYGSEDTLYLREAHFILALGPGEGRMMSEVAKALSVTKGAASQTAGRLERKGYIHRRPDPDNHRLVIASLTEKGRAFYERHRAFDGSEYAKMDRDYLSLFSDDELRMILEYEKRMSAIFAEAVRKDAQNREG